MIVTLRMRVQQVLDLKRSEIAALSLVAALAVVPGAVLWLLSGRYELLRVGQESPPFVVFSLTIVGLLCLLRPLQLMWQRHPAPTRRLRDDIIQNRSWLFMVAAMVVFVPESLDASTQIKKLIPQVVPFYADPWLINVEHLILGTDAWRLTHAVLGATATRVVDVIYGLWHLVNISALCWIVLTPNRRFQLQAALSYQLAWLVMGGGLAMLSASVGPCFYEVYTGSTRFAPLMAELRSVNGARGLHSLMAMDYLLSTRGTNVIGGGISAMPSLHVGIAVFVVLAVRDLWPKRRVVQVTAVVYTLIIFIASVHLGWHYALDGIVAAIGMVTIWNGVALLLPWLERRLDTV